MEDYENDRMKKLYFTPSPMIPYPHSNKLVTALGFNRIEENLPIKIVKEYQQRFHGINQKAKKLKIMEQNILKKQETS